MARLDDRDGFQSRRSVLLNVAGTTMLRATLLFGSAAMALALILTPLADRFSRQSNLSVGLDYMTTSSIERATSYTIRRSVLQKDAGAICIVRADGSRSGDC